MMCDAIQIPSGNYLVVIAVGFDGTELEAIHGGQEAWQNNLIEVDDISLRSCM